MAENFRSLLVKTLADEKRSCSYEDIETLVNIFGECGKNYPRSFNSFTNTHGVESYSFYISFLTVTENETEPIPFFKILEIDSRIGWVNSEHLEDQIFYCKATKIIKDQKVITSLLHV